MEYLDSQKEKRIEKHLLDLLKKDLFDALVITIIIFFLKQRERKIFLSFQKKKFKQKKIKKLSEISQSHLVYVGGKQSFEFLVDNSQLPKWTPLSKIKNPQNVRKIVTGLKNYSLVWIGANKLQFHQSQGTTKYEIEGEEIKDIQAGSQTYLILTKSGKVFSLASRSVSRFCEIPLESSNSSTWNRVRSVPFFNDEKNNRKVKSIAMVGYSNYFVCENGELYGNVHNLGRLGDGTSNNHKNLPVLIDKNVTRAFGGVECYNFFYTNSNNETLSCGLNRDGTLGNGENKNLSEPQIVPNWRAEDILDIRVCSLHAVLVTKTGRTYSCGSLSYNGHLTSKSIFTEINQLKEKKVIKIATSSYTTLVLTEERELYAWNIVSVPTKQKISKSSRPAKLDLPEKFLENTPGDIGFSCGVGVYFLYQSVSGTITQDFQNLLDLKKYCDSTITVSNEIKIPIHKLLLELRTGLKVEDINKAFFENNCTEEEIISFLKWAYYGAFQSDTLQRLFSFLNLSFPPKNKLNSDLLKLYGDEDSQDFNILVQVNDEDDEEAFEEIPVHKFLLLARSGLFRAMFENFNEKETNQVKDYSGKSIESLEVLIKYFYTDTLELTADHDSTLIVEELEDSIEYYQLNKHSNLKNQLYGVLKK
ncbi:btk-binding protein-related [Anaeramoeba flamelloides]|uniref:Btk-binding protein-related n=1 Tax=Anaeramoeba flamelloides TaxID=1746091 RepID=A0AAV7YLP3_9EUKA|nr:btk-binding protein-related [Anaeramoeba flamelloides]